MKKIILVSAFSLNMLQGAATSLEVSEEFQGLSFLDDLYNTGRCELVNAIGHADTARLVAGIAEADGVALPEAQRLSISLTGAEYVLVAQYSGPRLPEGATSLPEGARIVFRWVTFD